MVGHHILCTVASPLLSTLDTDDRVALDALPEETRPLRVEQGSASELDESTAGRAVRYPVSRQGRILLLGAQGITRCERYGAFLVWRCRAPEVDIR